MNHTDSVSENRFSSVPAEAIPGIDWDRVSYVGAIAFADDGTMLCIDQPRWIDIVGGHRDPGESPLEVLVREGYEEAGLRVAQSSVILVREGNTPYGGIDRPLMVYQVVTGVDKKKAARDFENRPATHRDEASGIRFLTPEDFISQYGRRPECHAAFLENTRLAVENAARYVRQSEGVRVGLIGFGDHNVRGHLVPLHEDSRVKEVRVFDPNPEVAVANFSTRHSPSHPDIDNKITLVTDDFQLIVGDPLTRIVFISSPDRFHADQTTECLAAGIHVFCEKPLIDSLEETSKLVENILLARQNGLILSSCHPRRFDPPFVWLKNYLESEPWLAQVGNCLAVGFDFDYPVPEEGKEGLHSGLLADHFNHEIDLVTFFYGFSHYRARRISDSQTEYEARGEREDGIAFHFTGARTKPRGEGYSESMTVVGTKGAITVDADSWKAVFTDKEGTPTVVCEGLFTGYVERFELTTRNMIDAVLAGGRNYLDPRDLLLNSVSGAALTKSGEFRSRDYQAELEKFE